MSSTSAGGTVRAAPLGPGVPGTGCLRQQSCLRVFKSSRRSMHSGRAGYNPYACYSSVKPRILSVSTGMPGPIVVATVIDFR